MRIQLDCVVVSLCSNSINDTSLLLSALTGWLPQSVPAPVTENHWNLLTSITNLNAASPADVKRAYLVACEVTRVREARRQVRVWGTAEYLGFGPIEFFLLFL